MISIRSLHIYTFKINYWLLILIHQICRNPCNLRLFEESSDDCICNFCEIWFSRMFFFCWIQYSRNVCGTSPDCQYPTVEWNLSHVETSHSYFTHQFGQYEFQGEPTNNRFININWSVVLLLLLFVEMRPLFILNKIVSTTTINKYYIVNDNMHALKIMVSASQVYLCNVI